MSRRFRLSSLSPPSSTYPTARTPSHFTSNVQLDSSVGIRPIDASIGGTLCGIGVVSGIRSFVPGGRREQGRHAAPDHPHRSDRPPRGRRHRLRRRRLSRSRPRPRWPAAPHSRGPARDRSAPLIVTLLVVSALTIGAL